MKPFSLKYILTNCDSRNYFFHLYRLLRFFIQDKIVRLNDRLTDVITISDFSENILKKTLSPSTHIHRVYNPIDLDPNREIVDYTKNDYFLYVGRISKEKGVDVFCEGVTKANKKGVVVGDGSELEKLKNKYPNIEFVGWKNSQEVKEYMKKAKALIIPSRWYEAAPLTPIEALQYGIPIISSDCNATIDYLESDKNGAVFSISSENLDEIISTFSDCYKPSIPFVSNYSQDITALYNEIIIVKES